MMAFVEEYSKGLTLFFSMAGIVVLILNYITTLVYRAKAAARRIQALIRTLQVNGIDIPPDESSEMQTIGDSRPLKKTSDTKPNVTGSGPAIKIALIALFGVVFTQLFPFFTTSQAQGDRMERQIMISAVKNHHLLAEQLEHWSRIEKFYAMPPEGQAGRFLCEDENLLNAVEGINTRIATILEGEAWTTIVKDAPREIADLTAKYAMTAQREHTSLKALAKEMAETPGSFPKDHCNNNAEVFDAYLTDPGGLIEITKKLMTSLDSATQ